MLLTQCYPLCTVILFGRKERNVEFGIRNIRYIILDAILFSRPLLCSFYEMSGIITYNTPGLGMKARLQCIVIWEYHATISQIPTYEYRGKNLA